MAQENLSQFDLLRLASLQIDHQCRRYATSFCDFCVPLSCEVLTSKRQARERTRRKAARPHRQMGLEDFRLPDGADVAGRGSVASVVARTPRQSLPVANSGVGQNIHGLDGVKFLSKPLGKSVSISKIKLPDDAPLFRESLHIRQSLPEQSWRSVGVRLSQNAPKVAGGWPAAQSCRNPPRSSTKPATIRHLPKTPLTCQYFVSTKSGFFGGSENKNPHKR